MSDAKHKAMMEPAGVCLSCGSAEVPLDAGLECLGCAELREFEAEQDALDAAMFEEDWGEEE